MQSFNFSLRKHLVISLILVIGLANSALAQPVFKLSVSKLAELKDHVEIYALPETLIDEDLSLSGDDFVAELSPITSRALGLPRGTKIIGQITDVKEARSLSRDAELSVEVSHVETPEGALIPAKASLRLTATKGIASNTSKAIKSTTKCAAATMVGAVDAVQYGGLATAVMTHGISVGVGAAIGLGLSLFDAVAANGAELHSGAFKVSKFSLNSDFELLGDLPRVTDEQLDRAGNYRAKLDLINAHMQGATKQETLGLELELKDLNKYFSSSYGEFVVLDLDLKNKTQRKIYPQDLTISSLKHLKPIYSNPLIYNDGFVALKPGEHRRFKLAFALGDYDSDDDYQLSLMDSSKDKVLLSYDLSELRRRAN